MRIMAIDYGDAHTGIAVSDPTGFLAGFTTVIDAYRPDMVAEVISHLSHHGATVIDAQGSYDHCDRKIVYSVVSTEESKAVLHAVKVADPAAFINVVKTQQISGRFYQKPNE